MTSKAEVQCTSENPLSSVSHSTAVDRARVFYLFYEVVRAQH